jgi:hypothetical protein
MTGRLLQVLAILLTQLSISSLLIVSLLSPAMLRHSFFRFHCLVCALTAATALLLSRFGAEAPWWDVRFLGLTVLGAVIGYVAFRSDAPQVARLCMIVAGLLGVVFGLMPLAEETMTSWGIRTKALEFFEGGFLFGAFLIGTTHVTLVLAFWYRHLRNPSFTYLIWMSEAMLIAVGLRIGLLAVTLFFLGARDPELANLLIRPLVIPGPSLLWFILRLGAGLLVPLVVALMTLQCAREGDAARATRLLAVTEVSVLVGEFCAVHLLI